MLYFNEAQLSLYLNTLKSGTRLKIGHRRDFNITLHHQGIWQPYVQLVSIPPFEIKQQQQLEYT